MFVILYYIVDIINRYTSEHYFDRPNNTDDFVNSTHGRVEL